MRYVLAVLLALAACGGAVAPVVLVVQQAEQAASAPAAEVVQAPASVPDSAPTATWRELVSEGWMRPIFGGYVRAGDYAGCRGDADQDVAMPPPVVPPGATWVAATGRTSGVIWAGGHMLIDDVQAPGSGWAMVHAQALPVDRAVRVSTVVDLTQDAGSWFGLTLYDGEADYREVALYWRADGLRVGWWAPCYWRDIAPVTPGARALRLTYTPPPASTCWTAHVDDALVHSEDCAHAGAALVGPPHVGLWVVNLDAEAQRTSTGRVRASVGRVSVEQLERP